MKRNTSQWSGRLWRTGGIVVLVIGSTIIGLFIAEMFLRAFSPQIFPVHPPGMYMEDSTVGRILTPDFSGSIQRAEFDAPFSVNSSGYRGPEPRPRRPNTVRIVALGDSQTFGFGVRDDETFCFHLERLLSHMYPSLDVQVVNTGSPTFGTYHQLRLLRSRWDELDPDIVLLQFLPVNDFEDNRNAVRQMEPQVRDGMLVAASAQPAEVRLPIWVQVLYWAKGRLHVARLISESVGFLSMRLGLAQHVDALWGEDFSDDDATLTQELLAQVGLTANSGGAYMAFLYSTSKAAMMENEYVVPRSRAVMEAAAGLSDATLIDLNELMREYERPHRFFFVRDGHWSAEGHRVIAEILARKFRELGYMSPRDQEGGSL